MAEKNSSRELTVSLNVDVSEALTGLKAVHREAKKATQALRELEAAQSTNGLRESLHIDLSAVIEKYIGVENNEENRASLAADIIREISGGESR